MLHIDCEYYPCHTKLEDCTFCYCPIYPCEIKFLGRWINKKTKVWDCSLCNVFHTKRFMNDLRKFMEGTIGKRCRGGKCTNQ